MSAFNNNTGLYVDEGTGRLTTAGYIYDTGTLTWIPQTNTGGGGPSSNVTVLNSSLAVTQAGAWSVAVNNFPSLQAVSGPLTDTQLRASAVPVSLSSTTITGSVAVTGTFWPATQPVSGTFWQATQPVSISTMPSTPVTGTFWQTTQPVSLASTTITGSVAVTGPLTDTQLRATPVPVSLTSTAISGTVAATQSGTWNIGTVTTLPALATGTNTIGSVKLTDGTNVATVKAASTAAVATDTAQVVAISPNNTVAVTGTFFQATQPVSIAATVTTADTHTTAAAPLSVRLSDGAAFYVASGGGGGANAAAGLTGAAVPTSASYEGFNSGGNLVGVSTSNPFPVAQQGSVAVTGTFWQTTQPVSLASTTVTGSVAVTGTFFQTTQPVSLTSTTITGTVAATQSGTWVVSGPTASGTAVSAAPLTVGGRASTTNPTAVADGQVVNERFDKTGRAIVRVGQARELYGKQATTITASVTSTTVVTAGGAGVFTDITTLTVTNSSATALIVTLSDGTTSFIYALAANGGIAFPNTFMPATTANVAWTLTCGTSVSSIYVTVVYEKNV